MIFKKALSTYFTSADRIIVLSTFEEQRALKLIAQTCLELEQGSLSWDIADGFKSLNKYSDPIIDCRDPEELLRLIESATAHQPIVYVLKDFHEFWTIPIIKRKLRSVAQNLQGTKKTLVILTPTKEIPLELQSSIIHIDFPLPTAQELEVALNFLIRTSDINPNFSKNQREKLLRACIGLRESQAIKVFEKALTNHDSGNAEEIKLIAHEKSDLIKNCHALVYRSSAESENDLGGFDLLKTWIQERERCLSMDATAYGLPPPKGIVILGIPGTGKNLAVQTISCMWGLPLLELQLSALLGDHLHHSEAATRETLRLVERISPCVLWIDSIDQTLIHGAHDLHHATRIWSIILDWMQEKTAPCFVIATASRTKTLPSETLRKGSFDEIFYLDVPTLEERAEIFSVHLWKRYRNPDNFDLARLAKESEGFVGTEIEQAIIEAMQSGFSRQLEFTTNDISKAVVGHVPASVGYKNRLEYLRKMVQEGRARPSSTNKQSRQTQRTTRKAKDPNSSLDYY